MSFLGLNLADHIKAGIEFKYMNGRDAKFATTFITNALFVGNAFDEIMTPEGAKCQKLGNCMGPTPNGDDQRGWWYPTIRDLGNGWTHALHLPG